MTHDFPHCRDLKGNIVDVRDVKPGHIYLVDDDPNPYAPPQAADTTENTGELFFGLVMNVAAACFVTWTLFTLKEPPAWLAAVFCIGVGVEFAIIAHTVIEIARRELRRPD